MEMIQQITMSMKVNIKAHVKRMNLWPKLMLKSAQIYGSTALMKLLGLKGKL